MTMQIFYGAIVVMVFVAANCALRHLFFYGTRDHKTEDMTDMLSVAALFFALGLIWAPLRTWFLGTGLLLVVLSPACFMDTGFSQKIRRRSPQTTPLSAPSPAPQVN